MTSSGELDLDLGISTASRRGRRPIDLNPVTLRELTSADIDLLNVPAETKPEPVKRLSERHHTLARLIAAGMEPSDAAVATDYGLARVSILQSDPAFQELIAFYRGEVDREFQTTLAHVAGLGRDAVLELRLRLEQEPDKFGAKELRELATAMLDRAGYAPKGGGAPLEGERPYREINPTEMSQREAAEEYARTLEDRD